MRLLIVGPMHSQIFEASLMAKDKGATVSQVDTYESALEYIRSGRGTELVMMDIGLDIASFISSLTSERISVPVVACGVKNDSRAAVAAIHAGAKEYIPLPPDAELIAAVLQSITHESQEFICQSPAMKQVLSLCNQVAPSEASILITGESGTGKEVIAKYIHRHSKRASQRMVSVNCAAIPENLLESELFGHEKGAFTGAIARRVGKFEEANNSTLLLDEISEMDLRLQAKLLRALQEREIDRVGGTEPVRVNIRVIATSNRDLQEAIRQGRFREDLYFRLNVIHFTLPPLRERPEDLLPLAQFFIDKYCTENGLAPKKLSAAAQNKLEQYRWPGNVREMENALHRSVLISPDKTIGEEHIQLIGSVSNATPNQTASSLVGKTIGDVEKDLILTTLDHCLGNRTQAATILGISVRTLRNKLNEYQGKTA